MWLRTTGDFVTKELQGTDTLRWFNKQTLSRRCSLSPKGHTKIQHRRSQKTEQEDYFLLLLYFIWSNCSGMLLPSFSLAAVASCKTVAFCHAAPAAKRGSLCWHPRRCKSWHQGPYLCIFQGAQQRVRPGHSSAWRHKPLLGEDNFAKRSSVHLTMVGDKPAAAAPSQPSSL